MSRGTNDVPTYSRLGDRQILKAFAERGPGGTGFAILAALLAHADEHYIAWPAYGTIARIANVSTRTVERWVPKLERDGFFRRDKVALGGRRERTEYDMSGFVQQTIAFRTDAKSVKSEKPVPTRCRPRTDGPSVSVPTDSRTKKPTKKPRKKPKRGNDPAQRRAKSYASNRCPPEFQVTEDLMDWAATKCPTVNLKAETEAFRDYEFSRPYSDWPATWRNWIRKASTFSSSGAGTRNPSFKASDSYYDEIRRAADAHES